MTDRMQTQLLELHALDELVKKFSNLNSTAIVDDDYPEVRYYFERSLDGFIKAMKNNGRFEQGNPYGLSVIARP